MFLPCRNKHAPLLLFLLCLAVVPARAQPPAVFTADQARRGQAIYPQQCGACHGPDMEGGTGPALTGPDFRQLLTDQNRTAKSLLDVIRQTMPYDAPGIDPDADYNDITAFILSRLGYPAGTEKLTPDSPNLSDLKLGS
jgi:mono/diheme cytochrome c family protein